MRERNPYKVLQLHRDADDAEIEDAYDRLFDEYEPQAHAGDAEAARLLEELNRAHDILLDPDRRAALDDQLASRSLGGQDAGRKATTATATMSRGSAVTATGPRQRSATVDRASAQGKRRSGSGVRPRSVQPQTSTSTTPFIIGGILLVIVVGVVVFLIARNANGASNSGVNTDPGAIVATVSGQPIYERELNDRYEKDRQQQLSEPLIAGIIAEGGITSTRVLDVIKQDALDKLINMEVIMQQARKENMYPDANTQNDLITQAKQTDVQPGQSFEDSLVQHGITEDQYTRNVVTSAVYRIMASQHLLPTSSDPQTDFINWICKTRQDYDVKILITFSTSDQNKPCSSGLPSDIDLTDGAIPPPQQGVPDAVPSAVSTISAPMVPLASPKP